MEDNAWKSYWSKQRQVRANVTSLIEGISADNASCTENLECGTVMQDNLSNASVIDSLIESRSSSDSANFIDKLASLCDDSLVECFVNENVDFDEQLYTD